jgi:hypothetical protein
MKDYGLIPNTVGSYPNTVGQNASGAGATDGTPYIKDVIDDLWGARQAIMDYAGLTPNGVTEAAGASQFIEAVQKATGTGAGYGVTYWKDGDPAANGDRVLLLSGQGVLRSNYPDLDAAVYVGDGNNAAVAAAGGAFYHADDAAGTIPNTAGLYLILPDTRGRILRGWDVGAIVDPDGVTRKLGGVQDDSMQGHFHNNLDLIGRNTLTGGSTDIYTQGQGGGSTSVSLVGSPKTDGVNGAPRTSSETRMANTQTKYGIFY